MELGNRSTHSIVPHRVDGKEDDNHTVEETSTDLYPTNMDELKATIQREIHGPDLYGVKNFFYETDVFYVERVLKHTRNFDNSTIVYNILYRLIIIAFLVYATIQYVYTKPVTTYSMAPAVTMAPIDLNISIACNSKWGCYNWTESSVGSCTWKDPNCYDMWTPVNITGVYDNVASSYCKDVPNFSEEVRSEFAQHVIQLSTCYSSSFTDGVTLTIPFDDSLTYTNGFMTVVITSPTTQYSDLYFEMKITPTQNKIVYLSQQKKVSESGVITYEPYIADQFYDGHADTNTATLKFKLQQFAFVTETQNKASYWTVLGVVGGFASFILPVSRICKKLSSSGAILSLALAKAPPG